MTHAAHHAKAPTPEETAAATATAKTEAAAATAKTEAALKEQHRLAHDAATAEIVCLGNMVKHLKDCGVDASKAADIAVEVLARHHAAMTKG